MHSSKNTVSPDDRRSSDSTASDQFISVAPIPSEQKIGPEAAISRRGMVAPIPIGPEAAISRRSVGGGLALFTDPNSPPPDIWQEAYPLIKEALTAYGFKGGESENAFWKRWLDHCHWHGETNFLRASIKHCKVFASQLLGEGKTEAAAVFARVAIGLEKLTAKEDARLNDLIAQQVNPEGPIDGPQASTESKPDAFAESRAPNENKSPSSDTSERKTIYSDYARDCKRASVKMTERILATLVNPNWQTRDPIAKWKQGKDRPGDDAKIRAVIKKGPQKP
jgi:hypothetical protein